MSMLSAHSRAFHCPIWTSNNCKLFKTIGAGIAVGVATSIVDFIPMTRYLQPLLVNEDSFKIAKICLEVILIAPILEEAIFRFAMQESLLKKIVKIPPLACIIITAIFFAVVHPTWDTAISAFIRGICFGILKESQNSLTGAIAAHTTNNFIITMIALHTKSAIQERP